MTDKTLERIKVKGTTVLLSHWVPDRPPHQARGRVTVIDATEIEQATSVARDLLAARGIDAEITDRRFSSLVEARDPGPVLIELGGVADPRTRVCEIEFLVG